MKKNVRNIRLDAFSYYKRLQRLEVFVTRNYSQPITAAEAAKAAGLAEKYFSTFFHQKTGVTFSFWLRRFRIDRAKELFETRNLTVSEVAFEVGFQDISTFIRAFKACERATPSAFRKRVRENLSGKRTDDCGS